MNIVELRKKIFNLINEIEVQDTSNFLPIETPFGSKDFELFKDIVNQGIDSHLEGFTKSKFEKSPNFPNKFLFNFDKDELPILLRRLEEIGTEEALSWKDDIENSDSEFLSEESDENNDDLLNIIGQFDIPQDIDYEPSEEDKKEVKDKWGNYIDRPMTGDEKDGIVNNIKRTNLGLNNDEEELKKIQASLDKQNLNKGGSVSRRMNDMKLSAN